MNKNEKGERNEMFDTHTHIIPGVDDGVQNMDEALAILKGYEKDGVKGVCLTPHFALLRGFYEDKGFYEEHFEKLKAAVREEGIDMALYLGSEIDEYDDLDGLISKAHTMNNTNHVLVDFGMREARIDEVVYTLKMKGYNTVVAHAERYHYMTLSDWKRVKKEGALLQVNARHLLKGGGKRSQKMAAILLKEGMVDLIASDIHAIKHIHTMKKAYRTVAKKKDKATAERLFVENPKRILGL
jgi:protein-tyrosine phosphatase